MKNKVKSILLILAAVALFFSAFSLFTACGDKPLGVDENSVVYSNGGTVVEYDGYVYFINGIPTYTDDSGETNKEGNVIKGGLYRAKLVPDHGTVAEEAALEKNLVNGEIDNNADNLGSVLDFEYEKWNYIDLGEYTIGTEDGSEEALVMGEDGKLHQNIVPINGERSEYRIAVEPVVNKKIGTSGYNRGGFWIYDGYIFFASPENGHNSSGDVDYNRDAFYCYDLNGGSLTKIRSATEVNASIPYSFYKYGDSVYLVTYESYYASADDEKKEIKTNYILSTAIKNGKAGETKEIVTGASGVYFTDRTTYDPKAATNTAEDYVYYTRTIDTDGFTSGSTTIEMIAPDGTTLADKIGREDKATEETASIIASSTSGNVQIEGVAGGYLYYRMPGNDGKTRLEYTNLFAFLKMYDENAAVDKAYMGTLLPDVSAYTSYLPIAGKGGAFVIATASDGVYNLGVIDGVVNKPVLLAEGSMTVLGEHDGQVFATLGSMLNSFNAYVRPTDIQQTLTSIGIDRNLNFDTFKLDFFDVRKASGEVTNSYISFFGEYHAAAQNYMLIAQTNVKYKDGQEIRGVSIPLGKQTDSEHRVVQCYDDTCLNWMHDHSSWDTSQSTGDEEEETEPTE